MDPFILEKLSRLITNPNAKAVNICIDPYQIKFIEDHISKELLFKLIYKCFVMAFLSGIFSIFTKTGRSKPKIQVNKQETSFYSSWAEKSTRYFSINNF